MRKLGDVGTIALTLSLAWGASGCDDDRGTAMLGETSSTPGGGSSGDEDPDGETGAGETTDDSQGTGADEDEDDSPIKFDAGDIPDGDGSGFCGAPPPVVCDDMDDDPWHAIGLNCPGGPSVDGALMGEAQAFYVHTGNIGTHMPAPYPPREGNKVLIMSTGIAAELPQPGGNVATTFDPAETSLPAPIVPMDVGAMTCVDNPDLVGDGDCSNTIQGQYDQGGSVHDYAELRFTTTVPANTFGFTYDFAMFSREYPTYYQSMFNDMYVAWLESEQWTGNISFDEMGNPISLNAGFLDYKDAPNAYDCPAPCEAPELDGTAMEGRAATKWLTTTAPVQPGEEIEVVFAVFDLSDGWLDTVIVLDNWQWSCDGGPPVTVPG